MLDDKTFLGAVREFYGSSHRLGRTTATMEIDHLRRLLEMAERWQADTATKPLEPAPRTGPVPCGTDDRWCHGACRRRGSCQYLSPDGSKTMLGG